MTDATAPAERASRVLIAEDERHLGVLLEHFLIGRGHVVTVVHDGRAALDALRGTAFDVALLDVQMPGLDGLAVLREVRALPLPPQVVVMTGNGTAETALAALQAGAYDYVAKPYRMAEVELLVRRATERRRLEAVAVAAATSGNEDALETRYAPLRAVLALVDDAAPSLVGMLVSGEPGTGRASLARRVHRLGGGGPLVTLDARSDDARDPHELARRLAAARGGTLHLRAADATPPIARERIAELLRVDGGAPSMRVVATTMRVPAVVRADDALGASLGALVVELPPLRARDGDVPALAESFARRYAVGAPPAITASAIDRLEQHGWPGNVAELRLVMEGAVARASGGVIDAAHLGLDAVRQPSGPTHRQP